MLNNKIAFKLENIDKYNVLRLENVLDNLKIKYKIKNNDIYIFLKTFNIYEYIYLLLIIAVIINTLKIDTNIKFNKLLLIAKKDIAIKLLKIFNLIKNYNLVEIKEDIKDKRATIKNNDITLENKDCIIEQKNKMIQKFLEEVLTPLKLQNLRELIEKIDKNIKNKKLKKYNNILINNLKIIEFNLNI